MPIQAYNLTIYTTYTGLKLEKKVKITSFLRQFAFIKKQAAMEIPFLKELFIIFSLSIGVIYVCNRVKIPVLVGFLITGVLCGPYGLGLVSAVEQVETLSEIGIVLLLFSIGMELHLDMLARLKKFVFIGGSAQALLTIAAATAIALLLGQTLNNGIFFGFLLTLSSTAIVLQHFQQKGQMDSPQGHICLAILIYQDLLVVPMVLLVPILAGDMQSFDPHMLLSAAIALAVIGGGFFAARKLVPFVLASVVRTRSRELFNITVLAICLAIALLTSSMGLSLALGAFMAGIILAESDYSQNAMEGVIPFKDIFTSLFFISVGMLLNTQYAIEHIGLVLSLAGLIVVIKTVITTGVTKILGYPWRVAIIVGIAISQVGEFSFVLAKGGLDHNLFSPEQYQLFLAASVLTMALAPFLLGAAPVIARRTLNLLNPSLYEEPEEEGEDNSLNDHLVIIGFGLGGQILARAAGRAKIKYVVMEMNPDTVRKYAALGEPIHYGDASHPAMLRSLGIHRARVLAIIISDPAAVRVVVNTARRLNSNLHIIARTPYLTQVETLKQAGASEVIPEEFDTALEMFSLVLSRYLVPYQEIDGLMTEIELENDQIIHKRGDRKPSLLAIDSQLKEVNVSSFTVEAASFLSGKNLADLALRKKLDLNVVAILREEKLHSSPGPDFKLEAGDIAYVFGTADKLLAAAGVFSGEKTIK